MRATHFEPLPGPLQSDQFWAFSFCRIDTPTKLARWLGEVETATFGISSHTRFGSDGETIKTLRAPAGYRSFYQFVFDYTRPEGAVELPSAIAIQLWSMVLAPHFSTVGRRFVDFARTRMAAVPTISQELWSKTLDFCLAVSVKEDASQESSGPDGLSAQPSFSLMGYDAGRDSWPSLLQQYAERIVSTGPTQQANGV